MPLHLIKLAVGCESVKELKGWVAERMATAKKPPAKRAPAAATPVQIAPAPSSAQAPAAADD